MNRIGMHVAEVASVGFTVALFFATAAVGPGPTLSELKMGALMTAAGAFAAVGLAAVLRTGTFRHAGRRRLVELGRGDHDE
jgi:hypothetical protein